MACQQKAIALAPKLALAHLMLGSLCRKQNKLDEAITWYCKTIKLDAKNARAHWDLCNILADTGQLDEAISHYRKAVELDSKSIVQPSHFAGLLNDRARQLLAGRDPKSRDPGRAVALAHEAAALDPKRIDYQNTLGVAHCRAGNWKAAVEALEKSRQPNNRYYSNDSVTLFLLSIANWHLDEKECARAFYAQAVDWRIGIGSTDEDLRGSALKPPSYLVWRFRPR